MIYKLLDAAQDSWRRVNAPHLVAVVRAGGTVIDGRLQERSSDHESTDERGCRLIASMPLIHNS